MRRVEILVIALALGLVLTGCMTVPTSGPIEHHPAQSAGPSSGVQVAPLPPAEGASQLLVVEGFLHAMSTYERGYAIARQYLTADASRLWRPESGVQVYADGFPPVETDQTVVLVAPVIGTIDASGVYRATAGQLRQDFGLIKNEDGQWRISRPPPGLLVSRYLFTTGFTSIDVQFLALNSEVLVPEPRYFPSGDQAATAAIKAVLGGPSAWLAPATRVLPLRGVNLESLAVATDGVAEIWLSRSAGALDDAGRRQILAELAYTLSAFPEISSVQVGADGVIWSDDAGRVRVSAGSYPQLDPADATAPRLLFFSRGGQLMRQPAAGKWNDFEQVQADLPKLGSIAVSRNAESWAAVSSDASKLLVSEPGVRFRQQRSGSGLLRPFFARTGELWSPTSGAIEGLRIYRGNVAVPVTVRGIPRRAVVAAALSPDGGRLALVLSSGKTTSVGLARVVRSADRIVVDAWREINLNLLGASVATMRDVGWNSITELAVLRTAADRQSSVVVVSQDGAQLTDIGPSDAYELHSLAVVPDRQAVVVSPAGGMLRFDGDFNWLISVTAVDAAAYSG